MGTSWPFGQINRTHFAWGQLLLASADALAPLNVFDQALPALFVLDFQAGRLLIAKARNSRDDGGIGTRVAIGATTRSSKRGNRLLQFCRRFGLLLPNAVALAFAPSDQVRRHSLRRAAGHAITVDHVEIARCRLRVRFVLPLRLTHGPILRRGGSFFSQKL